MNAWIKFSAARFCSGVPEIRAIRSPRTDLESEISTVAPEIWIETNRHKIDIPIKQILSISVTGMEKLVFHAKTQRYKLEYG